MHASAAPRVSHAEARAWGATGGPPKRITFAGGVVPGEAHGRRMLGW